MVAKINTSLVLVYLLTLIVPVTCYPWSLFGETQHKTVFDLERTRYEGENSYGGEVCRSVCSKQYDTHINSFLSEGWKIVNKKAQVYHPEPHDVSALNKPVSSWGGQELSDYDMMSSCYCIGTEYFLEK